VCGFSLDRCKQDQFGDGVGRYGECERATSESASITFGFGFGSEKMKKNYV